MLGPLRNEPVPTMYSKILVPIDGSATAQAGLAEAIRLARLSGGRIKLLHVIDVLSFAIVPDASFGMTAELFDSLKESGQQILAAGRTQVEAAGLACETLLSERYGQRVCDVVIDEVATWGAEAIVLGTHGRRGVGRALLGSDAEQIVRLSPVPVLLVRGREAG